MILNKYSMGIGDRFARQGKAQLRAFLKARDLGVEVTPVWNKSFREHQIIGTQPADVRREADEAARALGWPGAYRVDADHVGMKTVDLFVEASDFFTLDVADFIGQAAPEDQVEAFVAGCAKYVGSLSIPGVRGAFATTEAAIRGIARKYLLAVQEAGRIYRHIESKKGRETFVAEVSMDETETPQTPLEMFFILAAVAREGIPAQTIAPKFTGRFNKGVDYVGDVATFTREFEDDLAVIAFAVKEFGLPPNLKLSVHSGSDKFSLYPRIRAALQRTGAGLHLKTAGTTWLEELAGLSTAGSAGLDLAREIYSSALDRFDEMCKPYASVIDIDRAKLPKPAAVARWTGAQFAAALRHDQSCPAYNPHFRQLIHVGYRVAAEMGERYTGLLEGFEAAIAGSVAGNIFDRHLKPVFIG